MLNAINTQAEIDHTELRRLAWRCRRGLLELDLMLQSFVSEQFGRLDFAELDAFNSLLEWPDNDFLDAINHPEAIKDVAILSVINKIKAKRH